MPVPVYLLFSARLLEDVGVGFSRGRLSVGTEIGETFDFLSSIDFRDVYHDGPVGSRREILNARHSEVLIRGALQLDDLELIVCRSAAERETLLYLLEGGTRASWKERIVVEEGRWRLFYKRGSFLQDVTMSQGGLRLQFYANIYQRYRGPFDIKVTVNTMDGTRIGRLPGYFVGDRPVAFRLDPPLERYVLRVEMNGDLAYTAAFEGEREVDWVLP